LFCGRHDSTNFVGKGIFLQVGHTKPFHG
jgi:hypothetical protein